MAEESKTSVFSAMGANIAIAIGKLIAGLMTGSAAMLAEAGHSLADTMNQVFLLVGINLSDTAPDDSHPYGHGKEAFFWSFLAAIFIFVAGAAFSFFEGFRTLFQGDEHERSTQDLVIAYSVLGGAFLFEGTSFIIAVRNIIRGAKRRSWSFFRYIRRSPDLTAKTVFFEDGAALTGLVVAALGLYISEWRGSETWDAVASLIIGVILTTVALILGLQARNLLLGAAANPQVRQTIADSLHTFPEIDGVGRILTMQLGPHSVLVSGELELSDDLTIDQAEDLIRRIDTRLGEEVPEIVDTFWELKRSS